MVNTICAITEERTITLHLLKDPIRYLLSGKEEHTLHSGKLVLVKEDALTSTHEWRDKEVI